MKFLIDECLSIELVSVANQAGHEAQHVAHVGKAGWKDWNVVRHATDGDFVLVTNNAGDFRKLYGTQPPAWSSSFRTSTARCSSSYSVVHSMNWPDTVSRSIAF